MITFARVDDRVIHGQIITRWLGEYRCDRIVIVDDYLVNNPMMGQIYKNVVPTGIKTAICTQQEIVEKMQKVQEAPYAYFLIFKTPLTLAYVAEKVGAFVPEVNVGPASKRSDTIEIVPTIALTLAEIAFYDTVRDKGIKVYFQIVPDAKKVWWEDARGAIKR